MAGMKFKVPLLCSAILALLCDLQIQKRPRASLGDRERRTTVVEPKPPFCLVIESPPKRKEGNQ
jgi:hypothetical protein